MNKLPGSREKLLAAAREMFWCRGYCNVPLRDIAAGAGVDVALVKRHFGDKRGLFEATLECAFDTAHLPGWSLDELSEAVVRLFVEAPRPGDPSVLTMVQMNATDPEVGPLIRERWAETYQSHIESTIGDAGRAALFTAAVFGFAVAEKALKLEGIAKPGSRNYQDQLRSMLRVSAKG